MYKIPEWELSHLSSKCFSAVGADVVLLVVFLPVIAAPVAALRIGPRVGLQRDQKIQNVKAGRVLQLLGVLGSFPVPEASQEIQEGGLVQDAARGKIVEVGQ